MFPTYDVIVVGGGHAGSEAAAAAANLGARTLLVTMNMATIGQMSCNPAMGGIAKGQIVREIDALGGFSGIVADRSAIQFRMLNRSKGPAMWSPRTQNDRMLFANEWRLRLEQCDHLDFWQDMVVGLNVKDGRVLGVRTGMGLSISAKAVILTNGTFLNGVIHIGEKQFGGGRAAERASTGITEELVALGFEAGRMKTGTPPRVDGRSLDYSRMEEQKGDEKPSRFSFGNESKPLSRQRSCYISYTNPAVHEILKEGFSKSPMFTGRIQGTGPRYCPSIEDKIERFSERPRHQIFVEPEGWNTVEVYVNGFSTSLPEDIQVKAIQKIPGFENARLFRPGYAIEYDYFPPLQLKHSLETRLVENLYFAGQINGTTGYEEAAGQGLVAGINAVQKIREKEAFILRRDEAYIGVLIDDLINKGTEEPYRMFTSRAEYRLLLRQDNADLRLTPLAHRLGLVDSERYEKVEKKKSRVEELITWLKKTSVEPQTINPLLESLGSSPIRQKLKTYGVITRPGITLSDVLKRMSEYHHYLSAFSAEEIEQAEIQIKYQRYIDKEREMAERMIELEDLLLPPSFDYSRISALSAEAREKLNKIKPASIGQASRISGISPADISILMVHIGR